MFLQSTLKRLFLDKGVLLFLIISFVSEFSGIARSEVTKFGDWPSNCHALSYKIDALAGKDSLDPWVKSKYSDQRVIVKYDVVCFGDQISIESPVYTNGGDIFILGNKVKLASKLDTRVFRPSNLESAFIDPTGGNQPYPGGPPLPEPGGVSFMAYSNTLRTLRTGSYKPTTDYLAAFTDYYKCTADCRTLAGQLITAQMPNGLTPPTQKWGLFTPLNGVTPPTFNDAFRSGSIYVYAKKIDLIGDLKSILVSNGIRGGLGGAGTPPPCIGWSWENAGFTCIDGNTPSGLNTPGGPGSDAGNIGFYTTDKIETSKLATDLKQGLGGSVPGGPPGLSSKLRSPSALNPSLSGSVADFRNEGSWPEASKGSDGSINSITLTSEQLLPEFIRRIDQKQALVDYDYSELAQRPGVEFDKTFDSVFFEDYLTSQLWNISAQRTSEMLRGMLTDIVGAKRKKEIARALSLAAESTKQSTSYDVFGLCSGRETIAPYEEFPSAMAFLVTHIQDTCDNSRSDKISSWTKYMEQTGGAYNVSNQNISTTIDSLKLRLIVSENAETYEKIVEKLIGIQSRLIDIYVSLERARLTAEISQLQQQIGGLQTILNKLKEQNEGKPDFLKFYSLVSPLPGSIGGLIQAYNCVGGEGCNKRSDNDGENLSKLAASGDTVYGQISKLVDFFQAEPDFENQINATQGQISSLRQSIKDIKSQVRELLAQSSKEKKELARGQLAALMEILNARSRYSYRSQERIALVEEIVKSSILSYLSDPARQEAVLLDNAHALMSFLLEYPKRSPVFALRTVDRSCSSLVSNCMTVIRNHKIRILTAKFRGAEGRFFALPLYVISRGSGTVLLNLHNFIKSEALVSDQRRPL